MNHQSPNSKAQTVALFGEILMVEQLARTRVGRALPQGMELSQFTVLNHLAGVRDERTPAELAKAFHLTRGAMSNTLAKLEWAGFIHLRPDWDDARRKRVSISPAGRAARDAALTTIGDTIMDMVGDLPVEQLRQSLSVMRKLRESLTEG
ncbi:MAG: MarR family transcriptional regulator [Pseudomonadota bacterium]